MDVFNSIYRVIDTLLVAPYRWPGDPVVGWWLGTTLLALWAVILGDITTAIALWANRRRMEEADQEMVDRHHQSINALKAGDKESYKAINKLANEAFGNTFFLRLAMACASLWPAACALGWLQTRFSHVRFPLPFTIPALADGVGYAFIFIPLYILVRILFGRIKARIKLFRRNRDSIISVE